MEPQVIEIPPMIWAALVQKFPWAKEEPDEAVIFLLGAGLGVLYRDQQYGERKVSA